MLDALDIDTGAATVFHVAGTNGKGSTTAFIEVLARAGGWRTGKYTSPHILRFNERIVIDGEAVSDAKVFNALFSADGKTELVKEVATVYEPTTEEEPAHYAQGALAIPKDVDNVIIRFRIAPADGDEATFDVPIKVE